MEQSFQLLPFAGALVIFFGSLSRIFFFKKYPILIVDLTIKSAIYAFIAYCAFIGVFSGFKNIHIIDMWILVVFGLLNLVLFVIEIYYILSGYKRPILNTRPKNKFNRIEGSLAFSFLLTMVSVLVVFNFI